MKTTMKRVGGYDPAKGPKHPDNQDPTLGRGEFRKAIEELSSPESIRRNVEAAKRELERRDRDPDRIDPRALDHLYRVFCGEGANVEPEDFDAVAILVRAELNRRSQATSPMYQCVKRSCGRRYSQREGSCFSCGSDIRRLP